MKTPLWFIVVPRANSTVIVALAALVVSAIAIRVYLSRDHDSDLNEATLGDIETTESTVPRRIINQFGMEFVEIPAGHFIMGSPLGGKTTRPHAVEITAPFYLGVTEVTGWELSEVGVASGAVEPEEQVKRNRSSERAFCFASWNEADLLAKTLSRLDEQYNYRLPTEAEWEYSCYGKQCPCEETRRESIVTQPYKSEYGVIEPIKLHTPNGFGVYDMLRNAGEFCADWYSADYYLHSPTNDPKGPPVGTTKVVRGLRSQGQDRSYSVWRRDHVNPRGDGNILIGVRLVLEK